MTENKNNCKYCNYCKYFRPIDKNAYQNYLYSTKQEYRSKILYPGLGMCLKDEYTSLYNLSQALYKKRYYYQTCDEFIYSIHNWYSIEDSLELSDFPELRTHADFFRANRKYCVSQRWIE